MTNNYSTHKLHDNDSVKNSGSPFLNKIVIEHGLDVCQICNGVEGELVERPCYTVSDSVPVEEFADFMKEEMVLARLRGKDGWYDKTVCSEASLSDQLLGQIHKGNRESLVHIANYAMMLYLRGETSKSLSSKINFNKR